jgi:hypothetical protein
VNDLVYLYLPVIKPGLTKKFARKWAGPFKVTKKISDLNYEIISQKDKNQVVHINRLKKAYNQNLLKPKQEQETVKKPPKQSAKRSDQSEDDELSFHPFPLKPTDDLSVRTEDENVPNKTLDNPNPVPQTLTPQTRNAQIHPILPREHLDPEENYSRHVVILPLPDRVPELCHKIL